MAKTPSKKAKDTVRRGSKSKTNSTQRFLPISEIRKDTVTLKNGGLRAVIEVEALNFNLKSETEQQGIIAGYQSFVNTLSFPVQIVIRSSKLNIDPYIAQIREKAKEHKSELLKSQTEAYANFVEKIVEVADIMQKKFYVILPLDDAPQGKKSTAGLSKIFSWFKVDESGSQIGQRRTGFEEKNARLKDRVSLVETGLHNIGLATHRLETHELIELYYQVYNPELSQEQKLPRELNTSKAVL